MQDYNTFVRSFPQNLTAMMFGYKTKANFTVENEKADFDRADGRFQQARSAAAAAAHRTGPSRTLNAHRR